jgi:transcriptional regulator with XRE-family HTH domain
MNESMGRALRQTLAEAPIENRSQNRLAVKSGLSRSTLNQWVNGVSDPLTDATVHIAKVLYHHYGIIVCEIFLNKLFGCDRPDALFQIKLTQIGDSAIAPNEKP